MKIAIIPVAGISSRFNEGICEASKELKAIYTQSNQKNTLLYHLLEKCSFADRIVIVGGYKFENLRHYCNELELGLKEKTVLVLNEHYADLSSGYSMYLGLQEAFRYDPEEILFAEGDLDIDRESFHKVVESARSVLTYTTEPIYANKAVVLFRNDSGAYRYAFNSSHGLLSIDSPFSCILNSGQVWKFTHMEALRQAYFAFFAESRNETNLRIIQNYLDQGIDVELIKLNHWVNCNTREDYRDIAAYWEGER